MDRASYETKRTSEEEEEEEEEGGNVLLTDVDCSVRQDPLSIHPTMAPIETTKIRIGGGFLIEDDDCSPFPLDDPARLPRISMQTHCI